MKNPPLSGLHDRTHIAIAATFSVDDLIRTAGFCADVLFTDLEFFAANRMLPLTQWFAVARAPNGVYPDQPARVAKRAVSVARVRISYEELDGRLGLRLNVWLACF